MLATCVAAIVALSGCGATVGVYSDSILSDGTPGNGARIRLAFQGSDPNFPISVPSFNNWHAEGGTSMAGSAANSFSGQPLAGPATSVVVYSFGTNDAVLASRGEVYSAEEQARRWMDKANAQNPGATCIIWVLPNPAGLYNVLGQAQGATAQTYLTNFNNYLRGLQATGYGGAKFRFADWARMINDHPPGSAGAWSNDGIHPNAEGATAIGQVINYLIRGCA